MNWAAEAATRVEFYSLTAPPDHAQPERGRAETCAVTTNKCRLAADRRQAPLFAGVARRDHR